MKIGDVYVDEIKPIPYYVSYYQYNNLLVFLNKEQLKMLYPVPSRVYAPDSEWNQETQMFELNPDVKRSMMENRKRFLR